jgi:hypothetical protein
LDPREQWPAPLAAVEDAGLAQVFDGRLTLTNRGMLLSNEVLQIFV